MRFLKLLAGMTSLVWSANAEATNFVAYTLTGSGSGVSSMVNNDIGGTDFTNVVVQLSATFYVDMDAGTNSLNNVNYYSNGVNQYGSMGPAGGENAGIGLGGNTLSGSYSLQENYYTSSFDFSAYLTGSPVSFTDISSSTMLSGGTFFYGAGNKFSGIVARGRLTGFSAQSVAGPGPVIVSVSVTPVPEISTWAMMLAGFGIVGYAARRRQSIKMIIADV